VEAERPKPPLNDSGNINREVLTEQSRLFLFYQEIHWQRKDSGKFASVFFEVT